MDNFNGRKISLIHTGGTIAGFLDKESKLILSNTDVNELVDMLFKQYPGLSNKLNLRIHSPLNIMSEDLVPSDWMMLAKVVEREILKGTEGIVITHGTDTLSYTASALSYMLHKARIPIVLTGATLPINLPNTDAIENLHASIKLSIKAEFSGIFVVFKSREDRFVIHFGTRVTSSFPYQEYYLNYLEKESLGYIEKSDLHINPNIKPMLKPRIFWEKPEVSAETNLEKNILFFSLYPGFKPQIIERSLEDNPAGLILQLYHSGTVCCRPDSIYNILPIVKRASENSVIIFYTYSAGSNLKVIGKYESTKLFNEIGAIPMLNMTPEAVLLKVMWVMGKTKDRSEIEKLMAKNIFHEFIESKFF